MTDFFQKLGFGLKKTSARLTGGITDIFTKKKVDEATLDELLDLLITSDMGIKASTKIIDAFAKRRLNKDASPEEIKNELAQDIQNILTKSEKRIAYRDI